MNVLGLVFSPFGGVRYDFKKCNQSRSSSLGYPAGENVCASRVATDSYFHRRSVVDTVSASDNCPEF